VAFSSADEEGQSAAHLSTNLALIAGSSSSFTGRDCQPDCSQLLKRINRLTSAAQRARVWPCWQVRQ